MVKICLAKDGSVLVSCSEDGCICMWQVKDVSNRMNTSDDYFEYSDDVLVGWSKLKKTNENIEKIVMLVTKLEKESSYYIKKHEIAKDREVEDTNKTNSTNLQKAIKGNKVIHINKKKNCLY